MTTYKKIENTEVAIDQPITAQLFNKLRENPLSFHTGTSGDRRYQENQVNYATATSESKDRLVYYREIYTKSRPFIVDGAPFIINRRGFYSFHSVMRAGGGFPTLTDRSIIQIVVNGEVRLEYKSSEQSVPVATWNNWDILELEYNDLVQMNHRPEVDNQGGQRICYLYVYIDNPISDSHVYGGVKAFVDNDILEYQGGQAAQDIYI